MTETNNHTELPREIFFIDDDPEELAIFKLAMKDINLAYNLHYARSGDDLFKLLEQTVPDLIFLDLHLPGKSGITCLKMIRYNTKFDSIPIVIYSKLSSELLVDDCYRAKANRYLLKPVSVRKLKTAIEKIIGKNGISEQFADRENFVIK